MSHPTDTVRPSREANPSFAAHWSYYLSARKRAVHEASDE